MNARILLSSFVIFSLLSACNIQIGEAPTVQPSQNAPVSDISMIGTAVELTSAARLTQIAGSPQDVSTPAPVLTPMPTQCSPLVTSTVNANVRSGPSTAYDAVGALMLGQSATIVGRNDAYTWWYIDYPAAPGAHGWIAGSVVTTSCVPAVVQVVAAPPLPTAGPVVDSSSSSSDSSASGDDGAPGSGAGGTPDLVVTQFTITPATPVMGHNAHVRITVYNRGTARANEYTVAWYGLSTFSSPSCTWTVPFSNPGGGRVLECDFVFNSWYPNNKTSVAIVDANNQVAESNEGNNRRTISPFGVSRP